MDIFHIHFLPRTVCYTTKIHINNSFEREVEPGSWYWKPVILATQDVRGQPKLHSKILLLKEGKKEEKMQGKKEDTKLCGYELRISRSWRSWEKGEYDKIHCIKFPKINKIFLISSYKCLNIYL